MGVVLRLEDIANVTCQKKAQFIEYVDGLSLCFAINECPLHEATSGNSEFSEDFSALRHTFLYHESKRVGNASIGADAIVFGKANPSTLPKEIFLVDLTAFRVA